MTDFDRLLAMAVTVAELRALLDGAVEYALGGHTPPLEVVALWREAITRSYRREAGGGLGASTVGDEGECAFGHQTPVETCVDYRPEVDR